MFILQIPAYCTSLWSFYTKIQFVKGGDLLTAHPNVKEIASNCHQNELYCLLNC